MRVQNPVYLTGDGRAVPFGHKDGQVLLVGTNGTISDAKAEALGITENGAPGQGEANSSPEGVNTLPGSPAATPGASGASRSGGSIVIQKQEEAPAPSKPEALPATGKGKPGRKPGSKPKAA